MNNRKSTGKQARGKVKVTRNGPFLVTGGIPLSEQDIRVDRDGQCHGWREGDKYAEQDVYALCRCGHSRHKPFCDGRHSEVNFDGTEEAGNTPYMEQAKMIRGPDLTLTDAESFCAFILLDNFLSIKVAVFRS